MILIAAFVPFERLNDMISCAVLTALSLTDSSLILLWHESSSSSLTHMSISFYHVCACVTSFGITYFWNSEAGRWASWAGVAGMCASCLTIHYLCPKTGEFATSTSKNKGPFFRTPLVPFWPCVAIFVNWYLIAQLQWIGCASVALVFGVAMMYYFGHVFPHNTKKINGWRAVSPSNTDEDSTEGSLPTERTPLQRSMSLGDVRSGQV